MYKLEVQDLHKRYGSHEVLKGVSLAAAAGDEPVFEVTGAGGFGAYSDAHGFEGLAHYDRVV